MGLSVLSEKCRKCPRVDTCNNKRMEAMAFLDGPCERELATGGVVPMSAVKLCDGSVHVIDTSLSVGGIPLNIERDAIEEISKAIAKSLCIPADVLFGK